MRAEIIEAFEAAIDPKPRNTTFDPGTKSDRTIRREAMLLAKQFEAVIENLPDQTMSLQEFYEEIAGEAWKG